MMLWCDELHYKNWILKLKFWLIIYIDPALGIFLCLSVYRIIHQLKKILFKFFFILPM